MSIYINKMKSNLFFSWPYHFYFISYHIIIHLMFNSFFKKMQMSHGFKINLEIKVKKKVKESYLKLVKNELKQYKRR